MAETTLTVRIDESLKEAFTEAARVADRPVSLLLRELIRDYVQRSHLHADHDGWFRDRVAEAIRDADDRGIRRLSSEEVEELFRERRQAATEKAINNGA